MWFWKFLYWLMFSCRLYTTWSKLYRWLYQRSYKFTLTAKSLDDVQAILDKIKWKEDTVKEMWDSIGSPGYSQHVYLEILKNGKQPEGSHDCDEFSSFGAALLRTAGLTAYMLNVVWRRSPIAGHHVAIVRDGDLYHLGNWGRQGPYKTLHAVVKDIASDLVVGWSIVDPHTLKVVRTGRGLPDVEEQPL